MSNLNQLQLSQLENIKSVLRLHEDEIKRILPMNIPVHRFLGACIENIIQGGSKVLEANIDSIVSAIKNCAVLGLIPGGATGHAYLICRQWKICKLEIGWKGYLALVRRCDDVTEVSVEPVYQRDDFQYQLGDNAFIKHSPYDGLEPRGDLTHAYAIVKTTRGVAGRKVMCLRDLLAVRDQSDGYMAFKAGKIKSHPWDARLPEMCMKTVFKRTVSILQFSDSTLEAALAIDDDSTAYAPAPHVEHAPPVQLVPQVAPPPTPPDHRLNNLVTANQQSPPQQPPIDNSMPPASSFNDMF